MLLFWWRGLCRIKIASWQNRSQWDCVSRGLGHEFLNQMQDERVSPGRSDMNGARYMVCVPPELVLLALCPSRQIYVDYINGFLCSLHLLGLAYLFGLSRDWKHGGEEGLNTYFSGFLPASHFKPPVSFNGGLLLLGGQLSAHDPGFESPTSPSTSPFQAWEWRRTCCS